MTQWGAFSQLACLWPARAWLSEACPSQGRNMQGPLRPELGMDAQLFPPPPMAKARHVTKPKVRSHLLPLGEDGKVAQLRAWLQGGEGIGSSGAAIPTSKYQPDLGIGPTLALPSLSCPPPPASSSALGQNQEEPPSGDTWNQ